MSFIISWLPKILTFAIVALATFVVVCNVWIYYGTKDQLYDSIENVPESDVALVLGTSPKLMTGEPNPFFEERIQMAATLLKKKKVKLIIVSGDNETKYYNEPLKMYNALVELGVPKDKIKLDYAGFRTLDSIVRCKKVFGQQNITIITQPFHSHRALFISDYYDMNAATLSLTNIPTEFSYKVKLREYFARALAVWDLYIVHKKPKFLGEKETLSI